MMMPQMSRLGQAAASNGMNVLLLAVDDLRCSIGCYGDKVAKTPNIDRLAKMGTVFTRSYVQQAVCSASRASLLTGCRPDTADVDYPYNGRFINEFLPAHPSLPRYFSDKGYDTRTGGKIHHGGNYDLNDLVFKQNYWYRGWYYGDNGEKVSAPEHWPLTKDKELWKKVRKQGLVSDYVEYESIIKDRDGDKNTKAPAYERADVPDTDYRDGRLAESAVTAIREAVKQDQPFFIAPGFIRPHLPFNAPKKYWDLYNRDDFVLPKNRFLADNVTRLANASYEMPAYEGGQIDMNDEERLRLMTHAYYACVSFTDANIGKVLDEIERQNQLDKTIILLWSDHGFHLGENESFGKHTCFEVATHSPLIIAAPGFQPGQKCEALTEYVDIFPTLCELAGVKAPEYLEGTSLVPLMKNPDGKIKECALSQWPRGKAEGFSMRTDRYRYTEWHNVAGKGPGAGEIIAQELYDHQTDPGEAQNLADSKAELCQELSSQLKQNWKAMHKSKN